MRKAVISVGAVLLLSLVLGGTVFRTQAASAASAVLSVFVTNDSSHPVPVREQNTDANGNIKVHEQGTANVNVTNSSVPVSEPAVTSGATAVGLFGSSDHVFASPQIVTALAIHLTAGIDAIKLRFQGLETAYFIGPLDGGNADIVLALTRPLEFDEVDCLGSTTDRCDVGTVGALP